MCIEKSNPYISVIIPSYNYGKFIEQTINSVLNQTYKNYQLIIVDDGSTDNSLDIIYKFSKKNSGIKVLQHMDKKNHGLSASLQLGISSSDGEYVAILEADDLWTIDCLEKRANVIKKEKAGVIFNDIEPLIMKGINKNWFNAYVTRVMSEHKEKIKRYNNKAFEMKNDFFIENKIPTFSCTLIRKEYLEKCNFNTPVQQWLDRWLWCQLAQMTNFLFIPNKLSYWRLHVDSYNNKNSYCKNKTYLQAIINYMKISSKFWKELKRCLYKQLTKKDYLSKILLNLPVIIVMFCRLILHIKSDGLRKTILVILEKIDRSR